MADKPDFSFANPFLEANNLGVIANPYTGATPTSDMGLGGLAPSMADMHVLSEQLVGDAPQSQFTMPKLVQPPTIAVDQASNKLYVQGHTFDADDAVAALQSEALLDGPAQPLPTEGNWQPLSVEQYQGFLDTIKNPTTGRLFSKGFDTGVQQLKQLGGGALMLAGAADTGAEIVADTDRELEKLSPFDRAFTDIDSGSGVVEWFVANLGQQGPMLLESLAAGAVGAAAGFAAGGPGTASAGAFIGGLFGRKVFRDKVLAIARDYTAGKVAKDSAEYALLRRAAAGAGAVAANFASGYAIGGGDIYNEMIEQGTDPADIAPRLIALAGALPYALADSAAEVYVAGRALGLPMFTRSLRRGGKAAAEGAAEQVGKQSLLRAGASKARSVALEGVGVGVGEGIGETIQEMLQVGLSGQDLSSNDAVTRYINAFAGGFGIGAPMGGLAGLRSKKHEAVDLLADKPAAQLTTETPAEGSLLPPVSQADRDADTARRAADRLRNQPTQEDTEATRQEQIQTRNDLIAERRRIVSAIGDMDERLGESLSVASMDEAPELANWRRQRNQMFDAVRSIDEQLEQLSGLPPQALDAAQAQEGQLALFQPGERTRPEPPAPLPLATLPAPPVTLAPPAPPGQHFTDAPGLDTQISQQLNDIQNQLQRREDMGAAEQAMQEQRAREENLAYAQRELQLAQQAEADQEAAPTRRRRTPKREPEQLALFDAMPRSKKKGRFVAETPTGEQLEQEIQGALGRERPPKPRREKAPVQWALFNEPAGSTKTAQRADVARQVAEGRTVAPTATAVLGANRMTRAAQAAKAAAEKEAAEKAAAKQARAEKRAAAKQAKAEQAAAEEKDKPKKAAALKRGEAAKSKAEKAAAEKAAAEKAKPKKAAADAEAAAQSNEQEAALAWDDMDTGVPWESLSAAEKRNWVKANRTVAVADSMAEQIKYDQMAELPPAAAVDMAHAIIDDASASPALRSTAIRVVAEHAYTMGDDTNVKDAAVAARDVVDESGKLTETEQETVDEVVLDYVRHRGQFTAMSKGLPTVLYGRLAKRGLIGQLGTVELRGLPEDIGVSMVESKEIGLQNLPADMRKKVSKALGLTTDNRVVTTTGKETLTMAAVRLANRIRTINLSQTKLNTKTEQKYIQELTALYDQVVEAGDEQFIDETGNPLSVYFDDNGKPITNRIDGRLRVSDEVMSAERRNELEAEQRIALDQDYTQTTLDDVSDFNFGSNRDGDTRYFTSEGREITASVPMGRIKLILGNFLRKLARPPRVRLFKSQADLKAKNPELYEQIKTLSTTRDFDSTPAIGVSFGQGEVVIFTDRVATETQLRFVLAHEAMGHFGLRSIMGGKELNAVLDSIYESNDHIAQVVDATAEALGISKREATEEYLADHAGILETNLLARVWNAIKNGLNKIGVQFSDDMARYVVSQARRYVRSGQARPITMSGIAERMMAMETMTDPMGAARYASANAYSANRIAASIATGIKGVDITDTREVLKEFGRRGVDLGDTLKRFLGELKTMNHAARDNLGYRELYNILSNVVRQATQLRNKYNSMMKTTLRPAVEMFGKQMTSGATQVQIGRVSEMLRVTSTVNHARFTDAELEKMGALVDVSAPGEPRVNISVLNKLSQLGRLSLEQFQQGFDYKRISDVPNTEDNRAELRAKRDAEIEQAGDDERLVKAIRKRYDAEIKSNTMEKEVTEHFKGDESITEDSIIWKMYTEVRDTMDTAAADILVSDYAASLGMQKRLNSVAASMLGKSISEQEKEHIAKIADRFLEMSRNEVFGEDGDAAGKTEAGQADKFITAWNTALLAKGEDKYNDLLGEFFSGKEYDDVVVGLNRLKEGAKIAERGRRRFLLQNIIQGMSMSNASLVDAERRAKRSIAGGYVPFGRSGLWQVRVRVVDAESGEVYKPTEQSRKQLMYVQADSRSSAERSADESNAIFALANNGKGTFELEVYEGNNPVFKTVKLEAVAEAARQTVTSTFSTSLNEVINTLSRFGVNITPADRSKLIIGLTNQNANARRRLQRDAILGEDPNTIKYVSKFLESSASVVARNTNRARLDKLFLVDDPDSQKLWFGDQRRYDQLKARWDAAREDTAMPEVLRKAIEKEFVDYHNIFVRKEAPVMGNRYLDQGRRLVAFLDAQTDVEFTDFASGDMASRLKMWTTLAQLGMSVATATLNVIALPVNVIPAMAGYNNKNNFGGGFGWAAASAELTRAVNIVKNPEMGTGEYWSKLLADPEARERAGFTEHEAQFMFEGVTTGAMQAALVNALMGTSRGRIVTGMQQALVKGWMSPFSYTEQLTRRAAGLTTFRLAYDRAMQEAAAADMQGVAAQQYAYEQASKLANEIIDNSLGEYAMFNRPALFRGGLMQFVFIYKMFPVNAVQMLMAMRGKDRMVALGILVMFAGLKGLPFAEDMMDLLDTIGQKLGLGPSKVWRGSAERSALEALNSVLPQPIAATLWKGVFNTLFNANVASRVSYSDLVPGTSIGLAGSDLGRELTDIAGPLASFGEGVIGTVTNIAKYGAERIGLSPKTTTVTSILRNSPVTMLRALGDISAYMDSGAVVNQKGYVVTREGVGGAILARALGFYPARAVEQNAIVATSIRMSAYQRDVGLRYRTLWLGAMMRGDRKEATRVEGMVREWNADARGTGLEIRNFLPNARKALTEAKRTSTQRYMRSAPRGVRPETQQMMDILGVE